MVRSAMINLLSFFILLGFWVLLSGRLDSFHLTLGVISSALVAWFSDDLLFQAQEPDPEKDPDNQGRMSGMGRFIIFHIPYIPWILKEIAKSGIQVSILALSPNLRQAIKPRIIKFRTRLKTTAARVTLANSITLTPGTITIRIVDDDQFVIHALTSKLAEGMPGEMEERIARVFGEDLS
jgi:multicomponent Na+:H+ antiporter subunit E